MDLRALSHNWFNKFYNENVYTYLEKRFFKIVIKYLANIDGAILDAACGAGNPYLEKMYINKNRLFGIDIDPSVRIRNKLHENFIIEDLHHMKTERKFQAIISVNTWEHLQSPSIVLKNFYNSLSDRGIIIIIAPQRWHYISIIERILPLNLKNLAWQLLKGRRNMPYPAFYHLCSQKKLFLEAHRQKLDVMHFSSLEGPPLWLAKVPPLFIMASLIMQILNEHYIFRGIRSTFIAILKKKDLLPIS